MSAEFWRIIKGFNVTAPWKARKSYAAANPMLNFRLLQCDRAVEGAEIRP